MIQLIESGFIRSASSLDNAPPPNASEIVCLGRSNVGKSTFINAILNKTLAKSSATPGKTRLINFFSSLWIANKENIPLNFIDLPGFGYAKVSKSIQKEWGEHLLHFLQKRQSIKTFLHLIDARHTNMEIDKFVDDMLKNLCQQDQAIIRIYTKADKLTQSALNMLKSTFDTQNNTNDTKNYSFIFSAVTKNHRKMTSTERIRQEIISTTLGLRNDI